MYYFLNVFDSFIEIWGEILKIKMCLCHCLTHHNFEKVVFTLKNNLEHFAFFFIVSSEARYLKAGSERKKSLPSSREIHTGYGSMCNINDLIYGTLFKFEVMITFQCINWEQCPIGIKEHI